MKERQKAAQSKSVSELSQMKSISDFPIPTTIENLIQQAKAVKESKQDEGWACVDKVARQHLEQLNDIQLVKLLTLSLFISQVSDLANILTIPISIAHQMVLVLVVIMS